MPVPLLPRRSQPRVFIRLYPLLDLNRSQKISFIHCAPRYPSRHDPKQQKRIRPTTDRREDGKRTRRRIDEEGKGSLPARLLVSASAAILCRLARAAATIGPPRKTCLLRYRLSSFLSVGSSVPWHRIGSEVEGSCGTEVLACAQLFNGEIGSRVFFSMIR